MGWEALEECLARLRKVDGVYWPFSEHVKSFFTNKEKKGSQWVGSCSEVLCQETLYGLLSFLNRLVNDPSPNLAPRVLDLVQLCWLSAHRPPSLKSCWFNFFYYRCPCPNFMSYVIMWHMCWKKWRKLRKRAFWRYKINFQPLTV